jgi:hypothetical protein
MSNPRTSAGRSAAPPAGVSANASGSPERLTPSTLTLSPLLGVHPNRDHDISPWIDEQIWGHRLWDAQTPWLVFLEFLTVADARHREGALLSDNGHYPLTFKPEQRLYLRNILFNSDDVMRVSEQQPDSRSAWDTWLSRMAERAQAIPVRDFSYLRERFHSFDEFARVVKLLRGAVLERERNKRWSSRFIFPFGRNALYEDLNVNQKTDKASREYINFGRTGELLYLMLCRASARDVIRPVVTRMVAQDGRWSRLVALLQPSVDAGDQPTRGKSYLPYESHPVFDAFAEDWIAVSRLQLPGYDAYPHYVTLAGVHLLRYHMAVAAAWAGVAGVEGENDLHLVCEIVAPRKTLVRELALASYARNDGLSSRAVEQLIERIRRSEGWRRANDASGAFLQCRDYLQQTIWWGEDYEGSNDPDALLAALRTKALKGHRDHVGQYHRVMGREVGLVSRRGTTRFRYAPTDQLFRTLLFANVERRMELNEFLARLFDRYGLVIGDREAERVLSSEDFDKKAFQANAKRLEERLSSLGLLRRLSDACAYVINPYGSVTETASAVHRGAYMAAPHSQGKAAGSESAK